MVVLIERATAMDDENASTKVLLIVNLIIQKVQEIVEPNNVIFGSSLTLVSQLAQNTRARAELMVSVSIIVLPVSVDLEMARLLGVASQWVRNLVSRCQ